MPKNWSVRFYRKEKNAWVEIDTIELDDMHTGPDLSIVAKAFRQAPASCIMAGRVTVRQVR